MIKRQCSLRHARFVPALYILHIITAQADTPDYRLLFKDAGTNLAAADQQAIFMTLGLAPTVDGTGLIFKDMECPAFLFDEVVVKDLNADGQAEVILRGGNTCTSGGNGSSLWLLSKNAQGDWQIHLGFPAGGYTLLAEGRQGFPDIQTGGMGWCEAIWRWDGQTYQHWKNVPTQPGGCDHLRQAP